MKKKNKIKGMKNKKKKEQKRKENREEKRIRQMGRPSNRILQATGAKRVAAGRYIGIGLYLRKELPRDIWAGSTLLSSYVIRISCAPTDTLAHLGEPQNAIWLQPRPTKRLHGRTRPCVLQGGGLASR